MGQDFLDRQYVDTDNQAVLPITVFTESRIKYKTVVLKVLFKGCATYCPYYSGIF